MAGVEQWSNISQDGSYEGENEEIAGAGGNVTAAVVEGGDEKQRQMGRVEDGVEAEAEGQEEEEEEKENDDEALRQLRAQGFWFSDQMASLLPSTPDEATAKAPRRE